MPQFILCPYCERRLRPCTDPDTPFGECTCGETLYSASENQITIPCHACGESLEIDQEYYGERLKCECGGYFAVCRIQDILPAATPVDPATAPTPAPGNTSSGAQGAKKKRITPPASKKRTPPASQRRAPSSPRTRNTKGPSPVLLVFLIFFACALGVGIWAFSQRPTPSSNAASNTRSPQQNESPLVSSGHNSSVSAPQQGNLFAGNSFSNSASPFSISSQNARTPITARQWCRGYSNALTPRFADKDDPKPDFHIYHDGTSNSPWISYLDEMRILGFRGMRVNGAKGRKFPVTYNSSKGKWEQSEAAIAEVKARVDTALERGYYVLILPPTPLYANLWRKDTHEERLTDTHVPQHVDVFEQYVEAFKDYPYSVAFQTNPEVHMWDYELKKLEKNHPEAMTEEDFDRKFNAFCERITRAGRNHSPKRVFLYNGSGIGHGMSLPFPFADDPPPTSDEVYYGIIENNFGPNNKGWEYWNVPGSEKSNEQLKKNVTKRFTKTLEFLKTNNLGFLCKNWGSPYDDSPKPGMANALPNVKQITDQQCYELAAFTLDQFNLHGISYEYADLRSERQLWDNEQHIPRRVPVPAIDQLYDLLLEKQPVRQLRIQEQEGGNVEHNLGSPTKGIHMVTIGETITLTASPRSGYKFTGWTGHLRSEDETVTFTMPNDHGIIRANFTPKSRPALPVNDPVEIVRSWYPHEVQDYVSIDSEAPRKNYGNDKNLRLQGRGEHDDTHQKHAYLMFEVTNVPDDRSQLAYVSLKFLMHVNRSPRTAMVHLHAVDSNWTSQRLMWSNKPTKEKHLSTLRYGARSHNNLEFDITEHVKTRGNGIYAFKLSCDLPGFKTVSEGKVAKFTQERKALEGELAELERLPPLVRPRGKEKTQASLDEYKKESRARGQEKKNLKTKILQTQGKIDRFAPGEYLIYSDRNPGNHRTINKPIVYVVVDKEQPIEEPWSLH